MSSRQRGLGGRPLSADSPLLGLPNVMLTQHIAGVTWESMQAMTALIQGTLVLSQFLQ